MSLSPVIFVKYFDKGSTVLGAHQMGRALQEMGFESRTAYAREVGDVRDSILVFIKKGRLHHLLRARAQNNLLVLDVQDTLCFKRRIKNRRLFHGLIFRSQKPLEDYGNGLSGSAKIYLQWNPSYRPNDVGRQDFRICYLGDSRSFVYWNQIPDLPCVPEERFFTEAPLYSCHISIRSSPRDFLYKPTCKVSTAAACDANLITTRDEASVEVLGADYPYYTEPDLESIRRAIGYARETFGGPVWQAGLEKMREIRESHALDTIASEYLSFFARLGSNGGPPGSAS